MPEQFVRNMVQVGKRALENNSSLDKLVIVEYPPRADSVHLAKVTQYANQVLREAVDPSRLHDSVYHAKQCDITLWNLDIFEPFEVVLVHFQ